MSVWSASGIMGLAAEGSLIQTPWAQLLEHFIQSYNIVLQKSLHAGEVHIESHLPVLGYPLPQ